MIEQSIKMLQEIKRESESIVIAYSGGKDSLVSLDLCSKIGFKKIYAYYMYIVKGISFVEKFMILAKQRYNIEVLQIPHPNCINAIQTGTYCLPISISDSGKLKTVKHKDIHEYARNYFDCKWVIKGEKITDCLSRRIYISKLNPIGIDRKTHTCYPVALWTDKQIISYLKLKNIPIPENFKMRSFGISLTYKDLKPIKEKYPEDFEKIKAVFPFIDICIAQGDLYAKK